MEHIDHGISGTFSQASSQAATTVVPSTQVSQQAVSASQGVRISNEPSLGVDSGAIDHSVSSP